MRVVEGEKYGIMDSVNPNSYVIVKSNKNCKLCSVEFIEDKEVVITETLYRAIVFINDQYKSMKIKDEDFLIEKVGYMGIDNETGEFTKKYFKSNSNDKLAKKLEELETKLKKVTSENPSVEDSTPIQKTKVKGDK
jgi:site-specific DNA-adenine methylase